jgi:hypothetical protein
MADMMALGFVDKPLESRMMANYQVRFGEGRLEKQVKLFAGRLLDLFGINANRVKEEIQDRLVQYQRECYQILADAFLMPASSSALMQVRDMGMAIVRLAEEQMAMKQRFTIRLDKAASVVGDLRRRMGNVERRLFLNFNTLIRAGT